SLLLSHSPTGGMLLRRALLPAKIPARQNGNLFLHGPLVVSGINTVTFAAKDFSPRRGASDGASPQRAVRERTTKSGRKRPAAQRVAPNLACGFVARRLPPEGGDAPSSRLATGQIGRNERHRIYA